jgi:hypothetical protein
MVPPATAPIVAGSENARAASGALGFETSRSPVHPRPVPPAPLPDRAKTSSNSCECSSRSGSEGDFHDARERPELRVLEPVDADLERIAQRPATSGSYPL